ncbi:TY-Chap domain-containing protein [Spirillospora sp. NBC_01491]|uniref:TY-Chap domain-containing protein n=1 Tax=Spirillospora sp. NBC_01491 TaxID=2976007 RepID=UPI002E36DD1A|nr:SseB family protein [Spirillospora sp. NBC_01491]
MLEWSEFARRLGRELASLERDTILIVRERDESRHYVQAMREPDRLYAEAVSNNFLDGPLLLTLADEEVMSDAGWRPPADPAPRNWWTELPDSGADDGMHAVTSADYGRLADVMVTALRDVQGVRRPSDLVYESFHRHGNGLIELLDFGIDTADPSRVTKRRSSAADMAEAAGTPHDPVPLPAEPPGGVPPADGVPQAGESVSPYGGLPGLAPVPSPRPSADPLPVADPLPGADPVPVPVAETAGTTAEADLLEARLAEAKQRGDHTTYFELLLSADLVLPSNGRPEESPEGGGLPTITIGSGTYATVFTSPGALARAGGQQPAPYRRTSFTRLATGWPDPDWQLAINAGLPSEIHLDAAAIARLDATQRAAAPEPVPEPAAGIDPKDPFERGTARPHPTLEPPVREAGTHATHAEPHTAVDAFTVADLNAAVESGGVPAAPLAAPTVHPEPAPAAPQTPRMRPPHGTRLWHWPGDGEPPAPAAVYDAIGKVWAPVRADVVPAPGAE